MANTLLTVLDITRENLVILHQKAQFLGTINKQYDASFAKEGAKIGSSLKIRLPNEYVVRDGINMVSQDTTEAQVTLNVTNVKGVDLDFTSQDLTMDMENFSNRIIAPAMSVLAAAIEADAYSMYKDVSNIVDNDASSITFKNILEGKKSLADNLAIPNDRTAMLSTQHNVDMVDVLKGLFQDSEAIKKQYREGLMGRTGGLDFYENTHVGNHLTGTAAKITGYLINGAAQSGANIVVDTGATTFLKGDIFTIAGVNSVHPETKVDTGVLKKFVVTADSGAAAVLLSISPSIVLTGAKQNVATGPADNAALTKVGAGASESLNNTMVYQKDAFTFATADLLLPTNTDFAAREDKDGLSISVIRDFSISDRTFPCRLDILYGYKTLREQLACRIHADG